MNTLQAHTALQAVYDLYLSHPCHTSAVALVAMVKAYNEAASQSEVYQQMSLEKDSKGELYIVAA